ncbi:hypothetical protein ABZP36_022028 [Zizania latifolia]
MESPAGSDEVAGAVCCVCGDHGLPPLPWSLQLAPTRSPAPSAACRYCSELYPRVAAYRQCNWCLREGRRRGVSPATTAAKRGKISAVSKTTNGSKDDKSRSSCGGGCSRTAFCPKPGKPVKKTKAGDNLHLMVPPVPETVATTKRRKLIRHTAAGKVWSFRVKVRRYKLLTDVISCSAAPNTTHICRRIVLHR